MLKSIFCSIRIYSYWWFLSIWVRYLSFKMDFSAIKNWKTRIFKNQYFYKKKKFWIEKLYLSIVYKESLFFSIKSIKGVKKSRKKSKKYFF